MTLNRRDKPLGSSAAIAWVIGLCVLSAGCRQGSNAANKPSAALVGADRDEHGCIGSAGYAWCAREARCVRPWELAQETPSKGVANSAEAFAAYCAAAGSASASAPAPAQK